MKPYLTVKAMWGSVYICFMYLQNWGKLAKFSPVTSNVGRNTQMVIESVKFHISHQMKPYSRLKAICRLSYTCFNIFGELGQVGQIGPKYLTSPTLIHRNIKGVKTQHFTSNEPYSRVKANCFSIFGKLGQVGQIGSKCPKSWTPIHRKSSKQLNFTFHIKWNLTQM